MSNINVVQSFWNFAQLKKIKNKQVAKIWCLYLKKQKIGATMYFPEGLEDRTFNNRRPRVVYIKLHNT